MGVTVHVSPIVLNHTAPVTVLDSLSPSCSSD